MHVRKEVDGNIKASVTECVFFTPPQLFDNNIPYWQEEIKTDNANYLLTERDQEEIEKKKS